MPPTQRRLHTSHFRLRCAAGIANSLLPLLLLAPPLFAASPAKTPAKPAVKKPAEPKEVLIFKNGDQITGKLLNSSGTKIKFDSEVAGEITVPLEKIKELKSNRPFAIVAKEVKGAKRREPVVEGIIQLGAKGIIVTPIPPEKAKEIASTPAKPEAKPSEAKAAPTEEAKTQTAQPAPPTAATGSTPKIATVALLQRSPRPKSLLHPQQSPSQQS
jgi:hypothetical protein